MAEFEQNVEEYNVAEAGQTLDEHNSAHDEHNEALEEHDAAPDEHDAAPDEHDAAAGDHNAEEQPDDGQPQEEEPQEEEEPDEEEQEPEGDLAPQEKENEEDSGAEVVDKKWPGWPGESVFRMLVPAQKVGGIIGRKGEFIKKIVEETRARIKILDGPPGTAERAVMVSAKEEPDSPLPPAMDGLLRIHKRLIDGSEGDSANLHPGGKTSTRLLVAASQAGSLIGKGGGTVKSIQEESNCIVRVLSSEDLPVFALQDDRVVEVVGDASGVHKGIELIASHLRKFLVDRSIIPLFEMQMQMGKAPPVDHHMPPHQPWGPPQGPPMNAPPGPGYGHNPQYMPPPRQLESYYPPPDMPPPVDHQTHQGISAYGREAPIGGHVPSGGQSAPSMIKQITQQMQIPLSYADAVIGTAGSSISYIRRTSGATVTIQETRGVPNEMTVEISGTASQVQTAQQLIQNFMAEAAAPAAQAQPGAPMDQGYNSQGYSSYQAHGSVYASPPSNPGHAGGYGSVYGSNYGY
ncbi:flowering locus K homology domain [Punica granatum]|nr:flowering locus K homology domain [Punica granatum]PKI44821.1 hypothetical protein CRG98_034769 [Punica granatum]